MTITELMSGKTPDPAYEGLVAVDDIVVAIDTAPTAESPTTDNNYCVLQKGVTGQPMSLNPEEVTRQFVRGGKQTTVTSKQLTIDMAGTRYVGDDAQDYLMDDSRLFSVGQDVVTNFIYFNIKTGKGFKGKCAISVSSANQGNAGEDATFACSLKSTEQAPVAWTYSAV